MFGLLLPVDVSCEPLSIPFGGKISFDTQTVPRAAAVTAIPHKAAGRIPSLPQPDNPRGGEG